jgi:hypothetical protein
VPKCKLLLLLLLLLLFVITSLQVSYNDTPETNHVCKVQSVAAVLCLQLQVYTTLCILLLLLSLSLSLRSELSRSFLASFYRLS